MRSRNLGWVVLGLFFCSGATALVYEVVWSKLLSQMFGSTVYAQTVVLAVFMGGLAIGNRLFGKLADRLKKPVAVYGILEIGIGVYALMFLMLDRMADTLFVYVGSGIATNDLLILVLKGILSAGLLLTPTILMGGTLPLMATWLQRSSDDAGRRSARFYSVNSLGAVAGSALAGFWLVRSFGMAATLQITAAANIFIGGLAILLSRAGFLQESLVREKPFESKPHIAAAGTLRLAGLMVAMTGAVSMGLEVLAARSLSLIFGSSLQSFAIVLMAFILGIGLGSAWIASSKRRIRSSEGVIVVLLCLAAGWVAFLVFNIEQWVEFYRFARTGLGRTEVGYTYNLLLNSGIALVILGVPAALIGAVLPLMIRALSREGAGLGAGVGSLLTWNTLGAVVGVLFTGFVLMPTIGLRSAFAVLALVLGVAALIMAVSRGLKVGASAAVVVCIFVSGLFVFGNEGWKHAIGSGVFRVWATKYNAEAMELRKKHIDIIFYEDAPDATVAVEESDGIITPAARGLRINGKPDAGTREDMGTQLLTGHLPMLVRPEATDVFVLGLGSGVTAGALLAYPQVERVVVAENCEPVIRAGRLFADWNRNVVDDPRTTMWCEDARAVLKLQPQLYDVIITVPSNPWTAGIGSVFTKEYYQLAASRLKPGGIVAQWFQIYETQDEIVELVLRTFASVYPYAEVWDSGSDIVLLGSLEPWQTGPEVFQGGFDIERVRLDMWMMGIQSPEALIIKQIASQRTGFAIAGPGPVQSDLFPILEYAAPKAFFLGEFCHVLDPYDERTYQQLLAPSAKREILGSLPLAEVQMVLSTYSSMNEPLSRSLQGDPAQADLPCIFQTPNPAPPPSSSGTALDLASQAFAAGDLVRADQLVSLTLQAQPENTMARYLEKVIERTIQLERGQFDGTTSTQPLQGSLGKRSPSRQMVWQ